jgi:hypothetical protein
MDVIYNYNGEAWIPTAAQIKAEMVELAKAGRGPVTRKDAIESFRRDAEKEAAGVMEGEMRAERMMDFVMSGGDPEDAAWALATGWA